MTEKILVFGATGKFAGLLFQELAGRGTVLRVFVRKPEQGDSLRRQGAAEVALGDLADRRSVERALKGIAHVFYLAPSTWHPSPCPTRWGLGNSSFTARLLRG